MHLRRAFGAVAAAAAIISFPTMVDADSSSITSTTVPFMTEITLETVSYLGGSVLAVNNSITSVVLECKSQYLANCSSDGLALPQTALIGDTVKGLSYSVTSLFEGTVYIAAGSIMCTVTDSASSASCDYALSSWSSSGTTSNSTIISSQSDYSSTSITYTTLDVTSGIEKLAAATTTGAAPASTATTTSAPYTGTATSSPSNNSSSHSKAWIAGPVIGAIAGVTLIAGLAFWFLRRKKQRDTQGGEEAGPTDPTEPRGPQAPGSAPEMSANYMPSELHSNELHIPSELPPDNIARMELADSAQLDLDKKREIERRTASEMP